MEKKHIGIINLYWTNNYGAIIGAAALQKAVEKINNDYIVKTVTYIPFFQFSNRFLQFKDTVKNSNGIKIYLRNRFSENHSSESIKLRNKRFRAFRDNNLNITKIYKDAYEINKNNNYNAFITAFDVWVPKRVDNFRADGYFLKFANKNEKKIAYGISLDAPNNTLKKFSKYYRNNIKYLDRISMREQCSIDFIKSLTDKKIYSSCDPAFLENVDYYDNIISTAEIKQNNQPYIYVYILDVNNEIIDYANRLAKKKNMKIYYYSKHHSKYLADAENCESDGPAEFLHRIKYADYILTNSFHCVIFSLLYNKKFLSFKRGKSIKSKDLLEQFGISNRFVQNKSNYNIDNDIDYDKINKKINKIRNESLDYLKESLIDI